MTGLPGNGANIDDLKKLAKGAQAAIRAALEEAARALAANPGLKSVVDQINALLGRPKIVDLTEAELDDLINARHAGNQERGKPMQDEPPDPPKPPTFQYMVALNFDPRPRPAPETVWRSETAPSWFCVDDGMIGGGGKPNDFFPEIEGVEEPKWKAL